MRKQSEVNVFDIYMLTNTDEEIVSRENIVNYLKNKIRINSERFNSIMTGTMFNNYQRNVYDCLVDSNKSLESRQAIYDAVVSGKLIGGCVQ